MIIREVDGDLFLGEVVATAGDAALDVRGGSLLNDPSDASGRVVIRAHSIDLFAEGGIGTTDAEILLDTAATGRLVAIAVDGVYITEARGPLNVAFVGPSSARCV
ncbi:hypothetical protein [Microbacterium sp. NIBRBAC000506063]|uniref:hypothetical protein n=1 Tax=Microbacterium sp. NIBRBAC000506063 TaxID=2734618 RepID=UPI001BB6C015|nr:hypothetical protein [Microbacterium sp. NIBRBAC000506063]QTV78949.1 hypothetical protein KAE78_07025 [Microbacterium sp. NIBRBAC000506063]